MKRFWTRVRIRGADNGFEVCLDERPVNTPMRARLVLPRRALAETIAAEWADVADEIRPAAMPLTGLANAAIDHVAPNPAHFVQIIASHAATDLLCYRADHPEALVARQAGEWDPVLAIVKTRLDLDFATVSGINFTAQPEKTLARAQMLLAALSPWQLAALQPVVTISGSGILGLALVHGLIDAERAFAAAMLDELWQEEQWGADADAIRARAARQAGFDAASRFLSLLGQA